MYFKNKLNRLTNLEKKVKNIIDYLEEIVYIDEKFRYMTIADLINHLKKENEILTKELYKTLSIMHDIDKSNLKIKR